MTEIAVKDICQIDAVVDMSGEDDGLRMIAQDFLQLFFTFPRRSSRALRDRPFLGTSGGSG